MIGARRATQQSWPISSANAGMLSSGSSFVLGSRATMRDGILSWSNQWFLSEFCKVRDITANKPSRAGFWRTVRLGRAALRGSFNSFAFALITCWRRRVSNEVRKKISTIVSTNYKDFTTVGNPPPSVNGRNGIGDIVIEVDHFPAFRLPGFWIFAPSTHESTVP